MDENKKELDNKIEKLTAKYHKEALYEIVFKIEEIPIKDPARESDEYDEGLKEMRGKIIKLIEESI